MYAYVCVYVCVGGWVCLCVCVCRSVRYHYFMCCFYSFEVWYSFVPIRYLSSILYLRMWFVEETFHQFVNDLHDFNTDRQTCWTIYGKPQRSVYSRNDFVPHLGTHFVLEHNVTVRQKCYVFVFFFAERQTVKMKHSFTDWHFGLCLSKFANKKLVGQ